jgi:hypothetical protein
MATHTTKVARITAAWHLYRDMDKEARDRIMAVCGESHDMLDFVDAVTSEIGMSDQYNRDWLLAGIAKYGIGPTD